jgi:hypothetical protein
MTPQEKCINKNTGNIYNSITKALLYYETKRLPNINKQPSRRHHTQIRIGLLSNAGTLWQDRHGFINCR